MMKKSMFLLVGFFLLIIIVCSCLYYIQTRNTTIYEGYSNKDAKEDATQSNLNQTQKSRNNPYKDTHSRANIIQAGYPETGLYKGNDDKMQFVDSKENNYANMHSTENGGLHVDTSLRLGADTIQAGESNRITTNPLTFHDKTIMDKLCLDDECTQYDSLKRMKHPISTFDSTYGKAKEYLMNGNFQSKVGQSIFGDSDVNYKSLRNGVSKIQDLRNVFEASTIQYDFSKNTDISGLTIHDTRFGFNKGPEKGLGGTFEDGSVQKVATLKPSSLQGGKQIIKLSVQYYETSSSHGAGIYVQNPNGSIIAGAGTSNPQYSTFKNGHIGRGSTYKQWIEIHMRFDWQNQKVLIEFLIDNKKVAYSEDDISTTESVESIVFMNNAQGIGGGSKHYHSWDNLSITIDTGEMNKAKLNKTGMALNNLSEDNKTLSSANNSLHINTRENKPYPVIETEDNNNLVYQAPSQFTVEPETTFYNNMTTTELKTPTLRGSRNNTSVSLNSEAQLQGKNSVALQSGENTLIATPNKVSLDNSPQLCIGSKSTCLSKEELKKTMDMLYGIKAQFDTITVLGDSKGSYQTVPIEKDFENPVVIMKPMTRPGGNHGHIRIKNGVQQNIDKNKLGLRITKPIHLKRNNVIGKMYGTQEYELSFDIVPHSINGGRWESILHFSETNNNHGRAGDRIPALWFHQSNSSGLHIKTAIGPDGSWGSDPNYGPSHTQEIPLGTSTNIRIVVANKKMITYFNNNVVDSREAPALYTPLNKLTVYAGDPWYPSANATLYNLQYKPLTNTGNKGTFTRKTFECRVEEWSNEDDKSHVPVEASYMIVDEGIYRLKNGATIQTGKITTNHNWKYIQFQQPFSKTPVVFTQSQTRNGGHAITTRNKNVSKEGFYTRLQESEGQDGNHAVEEIGYIAIEPNQGKIGNVEFTCSKTGNTVNHKYHTIQYGGKYSSGVIMDMQTTHGGNTADLRRTTSEGNDVSVRIEEETSGDSETFHVNEDIGYLAFYKQSAESYKPNGVPIKEQFIEAFDDNRGKLNFKLYTNYNYFSRKHNDGFNNREEMDKAIKEYGKADKTGIHKGPIAIRAKTDKDTTPYQRVDISAPYVSGGANNDGFLLELYGYLTVPSNGYYKFSIDGDDAVDFIIEDNVVASYYGNHWFRWELNDTKTTHTTVYLEKTKAYSIQVHCHQRGGDYGLNLAWKKPNDKQFEIIPSHYFSTNP